MLSRIVIAIYRIQSIHCHNYPSNEVPSFETGELMDDLGEDLDAYDAAFLSNDDSPYGPDSFFASRHAKNIAKTAAKKDAKAATARWKAAKAAKLVRDAKAVAEEKKKVATAKAEKAVHKTVKKIAGEM